MKLLVIDDNDALVRSLKDFLGKDFVIDAAGTATEGLQLAMARSYDVIILDISLPDGSGNDVCREIRAANIATPILILSTMGSVRNRVDLLTIGADDYVVKPFSLLELRARLFALMRRMPDTRDTTVLTVGDIVINMNNRSVQRAGQEIKLRRKEFDILEFLVRNSGQVVSRSMIVDHIWEADTDRWQNTVDVHIKHLRDKIDRPFGAPLIKTAYGIGYVLEDISNNTNIKKEAS